VIFKPSLFYHYYDWDITQFGDHLGNTGKPILLPKVEIEWKLEKTKKIRFKYRFNSQFAEASQLANRLRLTNFNRLFSGNAALENQLTQRLSLSYNEFSFLSGTFLNAGISYVHRSRAIRSMSIVEGIDQINSLFLSTLPENRYNVIASFTKKLDNYGFTISSNVDFSDNSQIINRKKQDFSSNTYSYAIRTNTNYDKGLNFELGFDQTLSSFDSSESVENRFIQFNPYFNIEYNFLNDFTFKGDYTFTYYENRNISQINRFQTSNASLFYNREESSWSFELSASNLFNIDFRNENFFNEFQISDTRTFIQPRILLFKIGFKI